MYDVCIIGSGQSGLVTCKTFVEKNHNVIVLEKNNNTNGLFNIIKEKNYFKWSTSRAMSGFSDFPMDKTLPTWFTIQNYVDYLNSYKKHFHLDKYIQYNSEVIKCKQNEKEEWIVLYLNNGIQSSLLCKKLIICAGLNQTPKFPNIIQNYTGELIHTDHVYRNMTKNDWEKTFSGKRVILLGGAESAFDIGHIIVQYTNDIYFGSEHYIEWFYQGAEEGYNININKYILNIENNLFNTPTDTNLLYPEYSLPEPMSEIWHTCGRIFLKNVGNFPNLKITGNICSHSHKELCDKTVTPNDLFLKNQTIEFQKVKFMTSEITLPSPPWNSEIVRIILDLEKLRQRRLYFEVPYHIFSQLKNIFQLLETLGSARIEGNNTTLSEYVEKSSNKKLMWMRNNKSSTILSRRLLSLSPIQIIRPVSIALISLSCTQL